jgi:hypothetical protein
MPIDDSPLIDHDELAARARLDADKPPPEPYEESFNWWPLIFLGSSFISIAVGVVYYGANQMMDTAMIPLIIAGAIAVCVFIFWMLGD